MRLWLRLDLSIPQIPRTSPMDVENKQTALSLASDEYTLLRVVRGGHEGLTTSKPLPSFPEPRTNKVHWEHLLEEMSWLSKDFTRERKMR